MTTHKHHGEVGILMSAAEAARALLKFKSTPAMKEATDSLVAQVKGDDWNWIIQDELFDVCLRLLALHAYGENITNGTVMALLARALIAHETQPGGPYRNNDETVDGATNGIIGHLFLALGTPLPALAPYLNEVDIQYERKTEPSLESQGNEVTARAHDSLARLREPLRVEALSLWEAVCIADMQQEITMLPTLFAESLALRPAAITNEVCLELGLANFYTWMAYMVYDDIIDEGAHIDRLPVANVTLRKSMQTYNQLQIKYDISSVTMRTAFDKMDAANAWELSCCRFKVKEGRVHIGTLPQYGNGMVLAERAMGHMLGPLMISQLLTQTSIAQRRALYDGCMHYLIARQLNDDIHDWVEDLQAGRISFVIALLLRHMKIEAGDHDLSELVVRMQDYFWRAGLQESCDIVLLHTARARQSFAKSALLKEDTPFLHLLDHLDHLVSMSMATQRDRRDFLQNYCL